LNNAVKGIRVAVFENLQQIVDIVGLGFQNIKGQIGMGFLDRLNWIVYDIELSKIDEHMLLFAIL